MCSKSINYSWFTSEHNFGRRGTYVLGCLQEEADDSTHSILRQNRREQITFKKKILFIRIAKN